jgi:hypothetical protein
LFPRLPVPEPGVGRVDRDRLGRLPAPHLPSCVPERPVFAANMADRADWEKASRRQRQFAVAAGAELRRRQISQVVDQVKGVHARIRLADFPLSHWPRNDGGWHET